MYVCYDFSKKILKRFICVRYLRSVSCCGRFLDNMIYSRNGYAVVITNLLPQNFQKIIKLQFTHNHIGDIWKIFWLLKTCVIKVLRILITQGAYSRTWSGSTVRVFLKWVLFMCMINIYDIILSYIWLLFYTFMPVLMVNQILTYFDRVVIRILTLRQYSKCIFDATLKSNRILVLLSWSYIGISSLGEINNSCFFHI